MDTFDGFQKKASGFLHEGMRIFKDGLREAGRLVSATADATRLHIEKESQVLETHREYHRLGEKVYEWVKRHSDAAVVELDDAMRGIIERIRHAESEIAQHRERLKRMTVVSVPEQPTAVAETRAAGGATTASRKPRGRGGSRKAGPRSPRRQGTSTL